MSKRKSVAVFVVLVIMLTLSLMVSVSNASAGGMWSVWLFNNSDNRQPEFVRVYLDGTFETYTPPVPEDWHILGDVQAFASTGTWVAYCIADGAGHVRVSLQDISNGSDTMGGAYNVTFPFSYDMGEAITCDLGEAAFNLSSDGMIAFGVVYAMPGQPQANETHPAWELLVLDLSSGGVVNRLGPDTALVREMAAYSANEQAAFMPRVRSYSGDQLVFSLEPYASGGWFEAQGYLWQMSAGTLTPVDGYGSMLDLFQTTNEMVWVPLDMSRMGSQQDGQEAASPFHSVMYANRAGDTFPIFDYAQGLDTPVFINNGRQVAVHVQPGSYVAVNRNGLPNALPIPETSVKLVGAPDGYAFLEADPSSGSTQLVYHRIVNDGQAVEATILWQANTLGWSVGWSAHMPPAADLGAFAALPQ